MRDVSNSLGSASILSSTRVILSLRSLMSFLSSLMSVLIVFHRKIMRGMRIMPMIEIISLRSWSMVRDTNVLSVIASPF